MKAAVVRIFGEAPRFDSFDEPKAKPGGVLVDVLGAALSPRVRSAASGQHYASKEALPLVPGLDGVGSLADGRVVYFLSEDDSRGSMAERTLADERLLVPLPKGASPVVVAALMLPAISSWAALTHRAKLVHGERVLVLGATGASGQLAVQVAKHLGASEVVAVGRDGRALDHARKLGADRVVQLKGDADDAARVAEAASEVDIVLDYVWGSVTSVVMPALCQARKDEERALRWIHIGAVAGNEISLTSVLLRKRNLVLMGSGQGSVSTRDLFGCAPPILQAYAAGKLTIDARPIPLTDVAQQWNSKADSGARLVFVP